MISFADQLRQLQRQGLRRGTDDDAAKRAAKPAQVGRAGKDAKSVSRAPVGRDRTVPGERSSKDLTNAKKKSSAPLKAKAGAVAGMKRKRGDEDGGRLASNSKSRQAKKDSFFEADEMDVRPNSSKAWGGLDDDEEESEGGLGWDDNDGSDEDGSSSEEDKEASDSESDGSDDGRGKKSTGNSNKASASAKGKGKLEPPKDKNRWAASSGHILLPAFSYSSLTLSPDPPSYRQRER